MFDDTNSPDNGVFHSESLLNPNQQPEQPVGRRREIDELAAYLSPLANRHSPQHILVYGPAGVGKSTTVSYVYEKLAEQTSVRTVEINCWQYNTRPSLLTELLIQLGYPAPRKGKTVDELCSKLREWLDKNRDVALLLDEFDQLSAMNEVIYDLALLNQKASHHLGITMVSNRDPDTLNLDPRTESRLSWKTLEFESYSKQEIIEILDARADQAFRPGTITSDAIETIAERRAQDDGDCRKALETLLQIGRKADREGRTTIDQEYIDEMNL